MSLEEFADRLCALMPVLMRRLMVQERNYFARGLITLPQLRALQLVAEHKTCPMRDMARALGLKCSTVTGLVDRLVTLGLVKRLDSSEDRRVVLAAITPKGKRILNHVYQEKRRSLMELFKGITPEEREAHVKVFEKMLTRLAGTKQNKVVST